MIRGLITVSGALTFGFRPFWAIRTGLWPAFRPLRADLCHQSPAPEIDVGQGQRYKSTVGVLCQPSIALLGETPQALDVCEFMFDPGPDLRLVAIFAARFLVDFARTARTLIGEVACLWRFAANQRFLARIG